MAHPNKNERSLQVEYMLDHPVKVFGWLLEHSCPPDKRMVSRGNMKLLLFWQSLQTFCQNLTINALLHLRKNCKYKPKHLVWFKDLNFSKSWTCLSSQQLPQSITKQSYPWIHFNKVTFTGQPEFKGIIDNIVSKINICSPSCHFKICM